MIGEMERDVQEEREKAAEKFSKLKEIIQLKEAGIGEMEQKIGKVRRSLLLLKEKE